MSWTKRQLVLSAFEEAGLAAMLFDLTPDQIKSACNRLDAMMANLDLQGVKIGYAMAGYDTTDPDQDSGIPDTAYEMVITGLAIKLAPSYGKQISNDTRAAYSRALDAVKSLAAYPQSIPIPAGYPIGSGYKSPLFQPFAPEQTPTIDAGQNGPLELES